MEYILTSIFYVLGTGVNKWWDNGDYQIAFCRGRKGFIAFNAQNNTNLNVTLQVNMARKPTFGPLIVLAVS